MDFLKNEIASKKRVLDSATPASGAASPDAPPPPKYLKRSELDRIRQLELDAERAKREQERKLKLYGKPTAPAAAAPAPAAPSPTKRARSTSAGVEGHAGGRSATPEVAAAATTTTAFTPGETFHVSNEEAVRRLRQKGHPIRLFGESDKDRRLRLRALELIDADARTDGQRNDFARALEGQELGLELEKVAQRSSAAAASTAAGAAATSSAKAKAKATDSSAVGTPEPDSKSLAPKKAHEADKDRSGSKEPKPKDEDVLVDLSLVSTNPHKVYPQIYHAFKRVLKEWEQSLADRPEAVKRSNQGKMAAATQATSAEYLKPLFKSLRKRELEPDVLRNIAEIAYYMQIREYLKANDAYLRLSIGNAPWPIGVTMVGIHERAGRERIFSDNVAHVLNDETSRKYIQSLKRLLTFAQAVRPPADVSQKMG
ncbi:hypothetical protein BMF94_2018 [Rhodotorula taiwanensis]|uniref:Pre-mRNA-splicing factor 18 n=1 Tax=Rhodotorula taiwanensis TaxID=741276 RepID=A0A2S5BE44_9BASI|nr:hypothetical protein BMF94_2018 [Rhodotorula taiwanensis]